MTLIATQISKYGIIHAADSNLTITDIATSQESTRLGKKAFDLRPDIEAGFTVAGTYSVGGVDMQQWLEAFILQQVTSSVNHATADEYGNGVDG